MRVFKFGGASVRNADGIRNVASIIRNYGSPSELLVVVSATGKTTNALEDVLKAFWAGQDQEPIIKQIEEAHIAVAKELFPNPEDMIFRQLEYLFFSLRERFTEYYGNENQLYDQVVSYGEIVSSHLLSAYLNQEGIRNQFIDSRRYIQTNDNWREGIVDWPWSTKLIRADLPKILADRIIVTQGFLGGTIGNQTTTLGREGSDYSAAIFASCLQAESMTIWKDVPGIMNADPKRIENTVMYSRLSYLDAAEMTYYGATVIHPKTIRPLAINNIPLYAKSFIRPENEGTCIGNFEEADIEPAIIFKDSQSLIRFQEKDFTNVNQGNLSKIFSEFAALNIKINMMLNSAVSFTICANTDLKKFEKVASILGEDFTIETEHGLELVTIKNFNQKTLDMFPMTERVLLEQNTRSTYQQVRRK